MIPDKVCGIFMYICNFWLFLSFVNSIWSERLLPSDFINMLVFLMLLAVLKLLLFEVWISYLNINILFLSTLLLNSPIPALNSLLYNWRLSSSCGCSCSVKPCYLIFICKKCSLSLIHLLTSHSSWEYLFAFVLFESLSGWIKLRVICSIHLSKHLYIIALVNVLRSFSIH
jgi:hypothetical protein